MLSEAKFITVTVEGIKLLPKLGVEIALFVVAPTVYILFFDVSGFEELEENLGLYLAAAFRLMPQAINILRSANTLRSNTETIDVLHKLFSHYHLERDRLDFDELGLINDAIFEAKGLSFAHKGRKEPIFSNVSFKIKRGQIFGILGNSGSGKSTLFDIMLGFRIQQNGMALYKINNNLLAPTEAMQFLGFVPQKPFVFEGTLQENITLISGPLDNDNTKRLNRVLSDVSLKDMYEDNLLIKEGGQNLSGGQIQRIGIARAFFSGADIIFLDEFSTALDEKTKNQILSSLVILKKHRRITIILISHDKNVQKVL